MSNLRSRVLVLLAAAAACAVALLAFGAGGASAKTCEAPGNIGRVHVYSLHEINIGCHAADHGVVQVIVRRSAPEGFTCRQQPIGFGDTLLTCQNHVGSFDARWRSAAVTR